MLKGKYKHFIKIFLSLLILTFTAANLSIPSFAVTTNVMPLTEGHIELTNHGLVILDSDDVLWFYTFGTNSSRHEAHKIAENVKEFSFAYGSELYFLKNDGSVWYAEDSWNIDDHNDKYIYNVGKLHLVAEKVKKLSEHYILSKDGIVYDFSAVRNENTGKVVNYKLSYIASDAVDINGGSFLKKDSIYTLTPVSQNADWSMNYELKLEHALPFSNASRYYRNYDVTYVICENGDLWTWGNNQYGMTGHGNSFDSFGLGRILGWEGTAGERTPLTTANSETPKMILSDVKDIYFSQTGNDTWAVKTDKSVWHWGDGKPVDCMQYGNGEIGDVQIPEDLTGYTPREDILPEYFEFSWSEYKARVWLNGNLQYHSDYEHIAMGIATKEQQLRYYAQVGENHPENVPELIRKWSANEWANLPHWYDEICLITNLGQTFKDVKLSDYYYDTVKWAAENGITTGTSETTFSPEKKCTHAEILTFLWRAVGSPEPPSQAEPVEAIQDKYWYGAYEWAAEGGLISASDYNTLETPCVRADVVEYLWTLDGKPAQKNTTKFTDVDSSKSYNQAVIWAVGNNITSGTSSTTFSPDENCTRGQIVTFLYRYLK